MANLHLIRDICEQKGITQKSLAKQIKLSQQGLYSLMEKGSTTTDRLEKICKVLNVHPGTFFDGPEDTLQEILSRKTDENVVKLIENMEARIKLLEELNEERLRTINLLLEKQK